MNNLLYEKSSQYFWPSFIFLAIPKHGSLARRILCYVCLLYVYEGVYAKKKKIWGRIFQPTVNDITKLLLGITWLYVTQFLTINTFVFMFPYPCGLVQSTPLHELPTNTTLNISWMEFAFSHPAFSHLYTSCWSVL